MEGSRDLSGKGKWVWGRPGGTPRGQLRDRKKAPVLQEELGGWRKSARLTFNTWKAEFGFPEGSLSLWESEGEGAGERVFYQACDISQADSQSRGLPVTSTLDACLRSQVTGSHVHPWMPVGVTQRTHHTSASQTSSLGVQGTTQRVSGGPECVFSISTLEALVQQGGSWHLEETQISHLKMVPCKVSFSLEFALLHGEINYNNPFYFFQERKGLGPATFVCLGALSRWVLCFIPALQEDTGPSSALQGSPVVTQSRLRRAAGGPSTAVPLLERTCPPSRELVTASGVQTSFRDQETGACVFCDPAPGTAPYFPEPCFPVVE